MSASSGLLITAHPASRDVLHVPSLALPSQTGALGFPTVWSKAAPWPRRPVAEELVQVMTVQGGLAAHPDWDGMAIVFHTAGGGYALSYRGLEVVDDRLEKRIAVVGAALPIPTRRYAARGSTIPRGEAYGPLRALARRLLLVVSS